MQDINRHVKEVKNVNTVTFSIGFHPGGVVDGIAEQAVARHLLAHHPSYHRSCNSAEHTPCSPWPPHPFSPFSCSHDTS